MDWDKIHEELGAANKAESLKAEARSELRVKKQIKLGLREGTGEWANLDQPLPEDETDENDEDQENEI
jgi:hypothetical protein